MKLLEYLDSRGRSPFETWFQRINAQAAAKVTTALVRLEGGNTSNAKSLGIGGEIKPVSGPWCFQIVAEGIHKCSDESPENYETKADPCKGNRFRL